MLAPPKSNGNCHNQELQYNRGDYFDCMSVRLRSGSSLQNGNLFLSLKSNGNILSGFHDSNQRTKINNDFRAKHTREDLEIESGVILKRYGRVLRIFLKEPADSCFVCELKDFHRGRDPLLFIAQTNLLRKYLPVSVKNNTLRLRKLCKIMFYDLDRAICRARAQAQESRNGTKNSRSQMSENHGGKDATPQLSRDEVYSFRKFLVDLEEIRFEAKKECLFQYHPRKMYAMVFKTYYRINQFNLNRPKLHANEVARIQKQKFDLMWKLRQKILRNLVNMRSESFVLAINESELVNFKPEKITIMEQINSVGKKGFYLILLI